MASCRACCPLCLFWSTKRNLLPQESILSKVHRVDCIGPQRVSVTPSAFGSYWGFLPKNLSMHKKAAGAVLVCCAALVLALAVARHSSLLQHWGPQHSCLWTTSLSLHLNYSTPGFHLSHTRKREFLKNFDPAKGVGARACSCSLARSAFLQNTAANKLPQLFFYSVQFPLP